MRVAANTLGTEPGTTQNGTRHPPQFSFRMGSWGEGINHCPGGSRPHTSVGAGSAPMSQGAYVREATVLALPQSISQ